MSDLQAAAQELAARGWPVMPARPHGKDPLTRNGVKDATTDERTILHWFQRWPDANLAVACGHPGPTVLDFDDLDRGRFMLATLETSHPPEVATARGRHLYFQGSDQGTIKLDYGELRGRGSYVVVPPSVHPSGKVYTWLVEPTGPLPPLPDGVTAGRQSAGRGLLEPRQRIPHGERHDHLKDVAVRLVRSGILDASAIEAALRAEYDARCEQTPPARPDEFSALAAWAVKSEVAKDTRADKAARRWPRLPGHDADLTTIRDYLTQAARLPEGWQVEVVDRHGRYGTDPLTITVRRPGPAHDVHVRFEAQRDVSKPSALRGAFVEATNGASRMKYPKPAEASDFYVMTCALAHVGSESTVADETRAWLDEYLRLAHVIDTLTLTPGGRYDALCVLQRRGEFARAEASRFVTGALDPLDRWVAIIDTTTDELWIRAGELATYLRNVYGVGSIAQHTLDARIRELGGERVYLEENRRPRGGRHITLVLYRFPTVQAFPSVFRDIDPASS